MKKAMKKAQILNIIKDVTSQQKCEIDIKEMKIVNIGGGQGGH